MSFEFDGQKFDFKIVPTPEYSTSLVSETVSLNLPNEENPIAITYIELDVPAGKKLVTTGWSDGSPTLGGPVFLAGIEPTSETHWVWKFTYQATVAKSVAAFLVVTDI